MKHVSRLLFALIVVLMISFLTACAPPEVTVQGKIIQGETEASNVTVSLKYDGTTVETQTAADGSYVFTNVGEGSRTLSLQTTIEGRNCTVTRTLAESENTALTADIKVPANLNPPEVMALGGVGYIAGDLNIICE